MKIYPFFIALLLFSCDKINSETETTIMTKSQSCDQIPTYKNMKEVFEVIVSTNNCTNLQQLVAMEEQRGHCSIGRLSDVFYETINPEEFDSQDSAISFCINNKMYIDTIVSSTGEISVTPKFQESIYRYVANKDGLFRVGDYVTRIFKNIAVTTNINNLNTLLSCCEDDCDDLDPEYFYLTGYKTDTKESHYACLPSSVPFVDTAWKGTDDIMVMRLYSLYASDPDHNELGSYYMIVNIYNRHLLANIWWTSNHSVTCSGYVKPHYSVDGISNWTTTTRTISYAGSCNSTNISAYIFDGYAFSKIHHYEFNLSATVPGYSTASLVHIHP